MGERKNGARPTGAYDHVPGFIPGSGHKENRRLSPYISILGACSLSVGSAIGWGSFVVTSNSFLLKGGPAGSIIGMLAGALIMGIIGANYYYMMKRYPHSGGVYTYVTDVFGHDRGFLVAWFLFLTYASVFWANATSIPLFARNFMGDFFEIGPHYVVAGYDVWLGEVFVSICFILMAGILCMNFKKLSLWIVIAAFIIFTAGIAICIFVSLIKRDPAVSSTSPLFLEKGSRSSQIISIACMAPWAFVGFENISHSVEEFSFPKNKTNKIIGISVIITTLLYISLIILSVSAYPDGYAGWLEYISDLDNITGLNRYPTFYAVGRYMGYAGRSILYAVLFCLIISSLISMMIAISRLLYATAREGILPAWFGELNDKNIPARAVLLITVFSIFMPFVGRTAIGWIVDVTTIGTIMVYLFVSAVAVKDSRIEYDALERITGIAGFVSMLFLTFCTVFPKFAGGAMMAKESYFLFTIWGVLGFIFFRFVISRDKERRYGNYIAVWVGMLALVIFTALLWIGESTTAAAEESIRDMQKFYDEAYSGGMIDGIEVLERNFIKNEMAKMDKLTTRNNIAVLALFGLSVTVIVSNYMTMKRRQKESEEALGVVQSMAFRDQLTGVKSKYAYAEKEESMDLRIRENLVDEFAIVVCDVNGLKIVNDTMGHKTGDEYIKTASAMVCRLFKQSPVFRIGGDEFAIILEGPDYENRSSLMKQLDDIADRNNHDGGVVVAAGITDFVRETDVSFRKVFERADELMYARKRELKGTVMEPYNEEDLERIPNEDRKDEV